eukprot:166386-Karenia_brevis.AAC.1
MLSGRTGVRSSKLVAFLEDAFQSSVDVQCGRGEHCLLAYVTGYTAKASDALVFNKQEATASGTPASQSRWRQVYRMICKHAPLEQEMALDFASLPLMRSSYRGEHIYAPIPGSAAFNRSRCVYNAFLQKQADVDCQIMWNAYLHKQGPEPPTFIEWARAHAVEQFRAPDGGLSYKVRKRGIRGRGANKERTALGVSFPFELLDIYIGAWCAVFLPHRKEEEFLLDKDEKALAPEGTKFLKAALNHDRFKGNVDKLLECMVPELQLRGLGKNRIRTFSARI